MKFGSVNKSPVQKKTKENRLISQKRLVYNWDKPKTVSKYED